MAAKTSHRVWIPPGCVGAPPRAFVRWACHPAESAPWFTGDHIPYKGGLSVTGCGSGTSGNPLRVFKKCHFGILSRPCTDRQEVLSHLSFSCPSRPISFLGVMAQDPPKKIPLSDALEKKVRSVHLFFFPAIDAGTTGIHLLAGNILFLRADPKVRWRR